MQIFRSRRPEFDPSTATGDVPETGRVHWLERDPRTERLFKWGEWIFYAGLGVMAASLLVVYSWLKSQLRQNPDFEGAAQVDELGIMLLMGILLTAMLVPVLRLSVVATTRKVGTDGKRLFMRLEDGRELSVLPEQLRYTSRMILYRRYTFPLFGGNAQALYLSGELETWLAPLLRNSNKVSPIEALKYRWDQRENLLIWSMLFAVAAASLLLTLLMMDWP